MLQPEESAASEHLADIVQLTQDCAELATLTLTPALTLTLTLNLAHAGLR